MNSVFSLSVAFAGKSYLIISWCQLPTEEHVVNYIVTRELALWMTLLNFLNFSMQVRGYENGNFIGPTILCDVTTNMECFKVLCFMLSGSFLVPA